MLHRRDRGVLSAELERHSALILELVWRLVAIDGTPTGKLTQIVEAGVNRVIAGERIRPIPGNIAARVGAALARAYADAGVFTPRLLRDGVGPRDAGQFTRGLRLRAVIDAIA